MASRTSLRFAAAGMIVGLAVGLAGVAPAGAAGPTTTVGGKRQRCTIVGTSGPDRLSGTSGTDVICGLGGSDTINGGGGSDTIDGGTGDDTVNGGAGNDTIAGSGGNDKIDGGAGNDAVNGDSGNDRVNGSAGADTLDGGTGANNVNSGTGIDECRIGQADILVSRSCPAPKLATLRYEGPRTVVRGTGQLVSLTIRVTAEADVEDAWVWLSNGTDYFGLTVDLGDPAAALRSGTARDGVWILQGYVYPKTPVGDYRLVEVAAEANIKGGSTRVRVRGSEVMLTVTSAS